MGPHINHWVSTQSFLHVLPSNNVIYLWRMEPFTQPSLVFSARKPNWQVNILQFHIPQFHFWGTKNMFFDKICFPILGSFKLATFMVLRTRIKNSVRDCLEE